MQQAFTDQITSCLPTILPEQKPMAPRWAYWPVANSDVPKRQSDRWMAETQAIPGEGA